nr:predicted GPI-anchored protein 58 [Lolium perenne]
MQCELRSTPAIPVEPRAGGLRPRPGDLRLAAPRPRRPPPRRATALGDLRPAAPRPRQAPSSPGPVDLRPHPRHGPVTSARRATAPASPVEPRPRRPPPPTPPRPGELRPAAAPRMAARPPPTPVRRRGAAPFVAVGAAPVAAPPPCRRGAAPCGASPFLAAANTVTAPFSPKFAAESNALPSIFGECLLVLTIIPANHHQRAFIYSTLSGCTLFPSRGAPESNCSCRPFSSYHSCHSGTGSVGSRSLGEHKKSLK